MQNIIKTINEAGVIPCTIALDYLKTNSFIQSAKNNYYNCVELCANNCTDIDSILKIVKEHNDLSICISGIESENYILDLHNAGALLFYLPFNSDTLIDFCRKNNISFCLTFNSANEFNNYNNMQNSIVKINTSVATNEIDKINLIMQNNTDTLFVFSSDDYNFLTNKELLSENTAAFVLYNSNDNILLQNYFVEIKNVLKTMLSFELSHIGVNTESMEEAHRLAKLFELMFDFEPKKNIGAYFAQTYIEIMAPPFFGKNGHIAIGTNYIDKARAYLERKGFIFNYNSIKTFENGKPVVIYLQDDIAGFAVHLLQK